MSDKYSKYSVAFATGSRADYGIVRNYLTMLNCDEQIDLSILVTGSLLSLEYGHQIELIYSDGFRVEAEIDIDLNSSSNSNVIHSMAVALDKFGQYFEEHKYDLLIILGDRYEIFSVATAAAIQRIPILHLHGGEATYGNYDEFIRHAISKMSLYHFTSTEEYRRRVIQLGEKPDNVYNLGALGAENCLSIDENIVPVEVKNLKEKKYFVVLFHPETLTNISVVDQTKELLNSILENSEYEFVFIGSNADTHSDEIRRMVKDFVVANDNCRYFENLPTAGYHYLLKKSLGLIGNSSSGLIEAPSLKVYTINIGDRQRGRVRGNSVIDVKCSANEICGAIKIVLCRTDNANIVNPYLKINSCEGYYKKTKFILDEIKEAVKTPKPFYDIALKEH